MQYPATTIATLPENPNPVGFTSTYTIPPNPLTFTTWIGTNTLVITEYLPTDTDVATRTTANGGVLVTPAPTPTIVYEDQGTTYTVTSNETGGEALQTATFTYTDGDNTYTYTVRPGETGGLKPITVTQLPITVTLRPDPATYCPPSSPSVTSQPTLQPTISGNILVPPTPFKANPTFNFLLEVTTEVARLVIVDSGRLGDGGQYDLYINGQLQGTSPLQPASNTHICTDQDTVAQCELWGASVLQYWLGRDTWNIEIVDSRSHLPFNFFVHGRGYYYVVED